MKRHSRRICSDNKDVFGTSSGTPAANGLNPALVKELTHLAKKRWTGRIRVSVPKSDEFGDVYLYDGGLYAAQLSTFTPNMMARLAAAGTMNAERQQEAQVAFTPEALRDSIGSFYFHHGWITIDELEQLHTEYTLASIGALLALPNLKVKSFKDDVTAKWCTIPKSIADVLASVEIRRERDSRAWITMPSHANAETAVFSIIDPLNDVVQTAPEISAFVQACDGQRPLDVVAGACGLTRAEGIAISSALVSAHTAMMSGVGHPAIGCVVPEAFGSNA